MTAYARKLIKWFYFLFAIAAISMAVVIQAGRSFSHLLADYPEELSQYFSNKLNAKVSMGAVSAEWVGLKPMVDIRDLRILSQTDKPILALSHAQMRLDILGSLAHARLVWSALQLKQVQMDFVQTEEGFWHIPGIPKLAARNDQTARLDSLIDMSLLSRRIEFSQSQLNFHFASGAVTTLNSPLLRMENTGDFHRLSLQVDVDANPKTLTLIVEGQGDPRRKETFSSRGFIQLKQFPTNEPLAATTAFLLRGIKAEVHSEGALDASLWFTSRPKREGFDVVGKLGVQRLSVPILGKTLTMDTLSTDVIGHWLYSGQWQLALQQLSAKVNQNNLEKLSFAASAASFSDPVVVHLPKVDLQRLKQTLDSAGVLGEGRLRDVMRQLNPEGELHKLAIAIPPKNPRAWELNANLAQVGVNAWQGVPALRKVDGFVHANEHGGFVNIDSRKGFSMHYSPTYSAPMEYQQAKGQVAWWLQPDKNQIYVNSGALEFTRGGEHAKGYMWLSLPWKRNTGDIDLYLQIGATKLDASLYSKYTPAVIPHSLLDWLERSIGPKNPGFVDQVGFVYRGTLNNHDHAARSHQLFVDIKHAKLNYHPEWPALEAIDGRLLVSNDDVTASIDRARLFNSDVNPTYVRVNPNPDGHGALLQVDGSLSGVADDGLRVLRESMLRRYVGANMDSWKLDGKMNTRVAIAVPLDHQGTGARQQIDIDLESPNFEMSNLKLAIQNISGHLQFNETTGLTSEGINGTLFDEPVRARLSTRQQGDGSQTLIDLNGEVDGQALAKWTRRPEVFFLEGRLPYKAVVELNHKAALDTGAPFAIVHVNSSLKGVSIDLPAPYGKTGESERPFIFSMALAERNSLIKLNYDNHIQALFELDPHLDNKLLRANIALGSEAKLTGEPQFLVSGTLPGLDIEPWKKVQRYYEDYTAQIDGLRAKPLHRFDAGISQPELPDPQTSDSDLVAGLPFRADLLVEHYQVGPLALENLKLQAHRLSNAWKVDVNNLLVDGAIHLPTDTTQPLQINLRALHLTSALLGAKTNEPLPQDALPTLPGLSVDPRSLPLADMTVQALYLDDVNYGNWSLQVRPNDQGVLFDHINGAVKGVTVSGISVLAADHKTIVSKANGAKLEWLVTGSGSSTHFIGELSASDISVVLREWQKPDMLESKSARFNVDAIWKGDPQDFALKNMAGSIDIALEQGRFKSTPSPGSDGFLRLMAILNFDSLARRLRLDFSDLYQSGLAYDQISGKATFVPGTLTFTEPLVVKTPSSRLQMAGQLDLEKEQINTRLVATLPVVGSYTFFTAFVAGLPAAAGIYLASKLFKKQVDRATSLSYSIQGNWDNPVMKFDRLFESEDELIKSVNQEDSAKDRRRKTKK